MRHDDVKGAISTMVKLIVRRFVELLIATF